MALKNWIYAKQEEFLFAFTKEILTWKAWTILQLHFNIHENIGRIFDGRFFSAKISSNLAGHGQITYSSSGRGVLTSKKWPVLAVLFLANFLFPRLLWPMILPIKPKRVQLKYNDSFVQHYMKETYLNLSSRWILLLHFSIHEQTRRMFNERFFSAKFSSNLVGHGQITCTYGNGRDLPLDSYLAGRIG